jgi:hypothetical protein
MRCCGRHTEDAMDIPSDTLLQISAYQLERAVPGAFIYAVMCNDLVGAIDYADDRQRECLSDIVRHVYSRLPIGCRGSKEAAQAWLAGRELAEKKPARVELK